jgi:hypothetical protein
MRRTTPSRHSMVDGMEYGSFASTLRVCRSRMRRDNRSTKPPWTSATDRHRGIRARNSGSPIAGSAGQTSSANVASMASITPTTLLTMKYSRGPFEMSTVSAYEPTVWGISGPVTDTYPGERREMCRTRSTSRDRINAVGFEDQPLVRHIQPTSHRPVP